MPSPARFDRRESFYVPAASIAIGNPGEYLLEKHGIAFTQVEVDRQLNVSGTFKFTITNSYNHEAREFLTATGKPVLDLIQYGARVWIYMGYGDKIGQRLMMTGWIISVSTSFAEGGSPELEISGQDSLFALSIGTKQHKLTGNGIAEAVQKVASENGMRLTIQAMGASDFKPPDDLQTDLDFLNAIVAFHGEKNGQWIYFADTTQYGPGFVFKQRGLNTPPIGPLYWGVDLLSFKPEANLGGQVDTVIVRSKDEVANQVIVGRADVQSSANGNQKPATAAQAKITANKRILEFRSPVKSQDEATKLAQAELNKANQSHLKGEGETLGWPDLVPDTRIQIEGLCDKFNRAYYVTKTTHRFDSSGYRTRFSTEDSHTC
jgi:uncharacterized protein